MVFLNKLLKFKVRGYLPKYMNTPDRIHLTSIYFFQDNMEQSVIIIYEAVNPTLHKYCTDINTIFPLLQNNIQIFQAS